MKVCASYLLDNILGLKVALNAINSFQNIGKHKFSEACTVYIRTRKIQFGWSNFEKDDCEFCHSLVRSIKSELVANSGSNDGTNTMVDCIALCSCRRPMKNCSQDELRLRERNLQRKLKFQVRIFFSFEYILFLQSSPHRIWVPVHYYSFGWKQEIVDARGLGQMHN